MILNLKKANYAKIIPFFIKVTQFFYIKSKIVFHVFFQGKGHVFQYETSQVGPWNVMCTIDKQKYRKDRIPKNMVGETYNNDIHNVLNTFLCQNAMFYQ